LEAFAQLGTELDPATQIQLDRGYRMVELLKQKQYSPMNVVDQVFSIYAGTKGHLDKVPANRVREWETDFHAFMREQKSEVRNELLKNMDMTDDLAKKIDACIAEFQCPFARKQQKGVKAS